MKAYRTIVVTRCVPPDLAGERLDRIVAALLPNVSRRQAREIVLRGGVWQGDRRIRTQSLALPAGEMLTIVYPEGFDYPSVTLKATDILWEDAWLMAIYKQPGWYIQPTPWDVFGNVEHAVQLWLDAHGGGRVHLTHRLDRDTSGVLLISKRPEINRPMQRIWESGDIEKRYTALVCGVPPLAWSCDAPVGPGPQARQRIDLQRGRPALTQFQTLACTEAAAEIEALPATGRTHQIRVHAAHTGFPLLGDTRYGGPSHWRGHVIERAMLHAASLRFRHPKTGGLVDLACPAPLDYQKLREIILDGHSPSASAPTV